MKAHFLDLPVVQRICIVIMALSIPVFLVLYLITGQREGAVYRDGLLFPAVQGDQTVYTGRANGNAASFTVSPGPVVEFRYGGKTYGPYTVTEDPSAVPKSHDFSQASTGVVVTDNGATLFRGGWVKGPPTDLLINADGTWFGAGFFTFTLSDGRSYDENGNLIDRNEPDVASILTFSYGPELHHRGDWRGFGAGLLIALAGIFSTLFADELFRLHLSWSVRDPYAADPSDWELFGRTVGALAFVLFVLVIQCMGLRAIV